MNIPDNDVDYELSQLLERVREETRERNPNPSPSPPPPTPLPLELQNEIKFATNLLKIFKRTESNQSIIFSPSTILSALNSLINNVNEKAGKEIENLIGKDLNYDKKYFKDLLYSNNLFFSSGSTLLSPSLGPASKVFKNNFKFIDFSDKVRATEVRVYYINRFIRFITEKG